MSATADFSHHSRLRGAVLPALGEIASSLRTLLELTDARLLRQQNFDLDRGDYVRAARTAVDAESRLWQVLFDEEDQMLQIRMDSDLRRRSTALGAAALAVLVSILVAFLVLQTVTRPVKQAVEIANKIARGEIPEKLEYTRSNDEMGVLLGSIEKMLQFLDLKTTMRTLQESASMLTDHMLGKKLDDLAGTTREDIMEMLGVKVSYARIKCATLSLGLLRLALAEAGVSISEHLED